MSCLRPNPRPHSQAEFQLGFRVSFVKVFFQCLLYFTDPSTACVCPAHAPCMSAFRLVRFRFQSRLKFSSVGQFRTLEYEFRVYCTQNSNHGLAVPPATSIHHKHRGQKRLQDSSYRESSEGSSWSSVYEPVLSPQRLQYPLFKEYTLNYSRIPNMI